MNTIVKSSAGIALVPIESRLLGERKIFIKGEIDSDTAYNFVSTVMLLTREDAERPINIYVVNSPGGVGGSATSIQRTAESIMNTKQILVGILSEDTGRSRREIEKALAYDNYMNAEESIAFGLCDSIERAIA